MDSKIHNIFNLTFDHEMILYDTVHRRSAAAIMITGVSSLDFNINSGSWEKA